jgi:septum site-determining protein MinC
MPPLLTGGRACVVDPAAARKAETKVALKPSGSLLLESPVRSGQTVIFPEGDVTILGSVGSGAEVVAGGSIHVYGALRGRAMAGVNGHSSARIYCQKIEAELLAIDGFYQTADDIDAALRGGPAQAWLQGNTMRITALN